MIVRRKVVTVRMFLLTMVLLASSLAFTQLSGQGGSQQTPTGMQPAMTAERSINSEVSVLVDPGKIYNAKAPSEWVGKSVVLQNVQVQDTNNSGNFWVGSDSDHRLLVVEEESNENLKAMKFHKGDIVTVSGAVQPASRYAAKTTSASSGSMHDAEKGSGIFLLANQIQVASSTQR